MTTPLWAWPGYWDEPASDGDEAPARAGSKEGESRAHLYPADPAPAVDPEAQDPDDSSGELYTRPDGQQRVIRFLWPPAPYAWLEAPLGRLEAVCEWLDERFANWLDAALLLVGAIWFTILGLLMVTR